MRKQTKQSAKPFPPLESQPVDLSGRHFYLTKRQKKKNGKKKEI